MSRTICLLSILSMVLGISTAEAQIEFLFEWGGHGSGEGQFYYPNAVAADTDGCVYVADSSNNRVQKFTSDGVFLLQWGTQGSGEGQFYYLSGIAVGLDNNVYVSDFNNNRVQKFTSDGVFLLQWSHGLDNPAGIDVDSEGNVYVADNGNNRVQKFTSDGVFLLQWGTQGSDPGELANPEDVGVDSDGNVYVADRSNYRIQKFTNDGVFLLQWGTRGSGNGQFKAPFGVLIDEYNNVYIADDTNDSLQKFTSDGVFIVGIYVNGARAVCQGPDQVIYVAKTYDDKIAAFGGPSVPVAISNLTAVRSGHVVTISWEVNASPDLFSFRINRGPSTEDNVCLNDTPLFGQRRYELVDQDPPSSETQYWLEVITADNQYWYGSVKVGAVPSPELSIEVYPNPLNASSTISYSLPTDCRVSIKLYDLRGRLVDVLLNKSEAMGKHSMPYNPSLASGQYLLKVTGGEQYRVEKITLVK